MSDSVFKFTLDLRTLAHFKSGSWMMLEFGGVSCYQQVRSVQIINHGPLLGVMVKAWVVQRENMGSSKESSHLMQKSQSLGLYPIHPSQHPVITGPMIIAFF